MHIPVDKCFPISDYLVEPTGIKDFDNTPKIVTFPPSTDQIMQTVTIDLVTDNIAESQEGFFLVLEIIEEPETPIDVDIIQNITLGAINDDDSKY